MNTKLIINRLSTDYLYAKDTNLSITVDDHIDINSENPTQNKAIAKSLFNLIEDNGYITIEELTGSLAGAYKIHKIFTGSGTPENPYRMGSAADFKNLVKYIQGDNSFLSSCFVQDADIDIGEEQDWHGLQGPVENSNNPFTGIWDGNGHTFTSIQTPSPNRTASYYQGGLFNCLSNATVKNLIVSSDCDYSSIDSKMEGSIIAGQLLGTTTFDNVITRGTLLAKNNCGAFMSLKMHPKTPDETNNIVFKNCVNEANIKIIGIQSDSGNAAGFIGKVQSNTNIIFENCENKGHIRNENDIRERHLAGFVGDSQTHNISCINCVNTGLIDDFKGQYSQFVGHRPTHFTMIGDNYCLSTQLANVPGIEFGTLDTEKSLVKLVAAADIVAGNTYRVMTNAVSAEVTLAAGQSVTLDQTLNEAFVLTPADPASIEFEVSGEVSARKYTAKAKA